MTKGALRNCERLFCNGIRILHFDGFTHVYVSFQPVNTAEINKSKRKCQLCVLKTENKFIDLLIIITSETIAYYMQTNE